MPDGSDFDYTFENKTKWRRSVWNAIHHRLSKLTVRTKYATCLYLAAELDLDWSVACEHGFQRHNMIAAERDSAVARKLRSEGVLTFKGDINDAIDGWPRNIYLNVINADFCCGIVNGIGVFVNELSGNPKTYGSVISVNLLRGRDAQSSEMRETYESVMKEAGFSDRQVYKHRGRQLLCLLMDHVWAGFEQLNFNWIDEFDVDMCSPLFYSYRSECGQTFDSVIFINNLVSAYLPRHVFDKHFPPTSPEMAAISAHRTRRLSKAIESSLTRAA